MILNTPPRGGWPKGALTVSTLTLIQIGMRLDVAEEAYITAREAHKAATNDDAPAKEILDLAKRLSRAESALDSLSRSYASACVANYRRVQSEVEKAQKRYDAQAKKEERARAQARAKADREAKRAADRKANKRAKALDRCCSLHLAAIEKAKNPIERMVADRISDALIESSLDACIECKDSGRIAFAHAMFSAAYTRLRSVLENVGVVESEGLLAVVAKYEVVLARAGFNSLSLRESLKRAA